MKDFFKKILNYIPALLILIAAAILRFKNLGYSDYQGDEIKALFPTDQNDIFAFLLDQRKGPGQFLITYLVRFINHDYSNELLTRLPFAIAGFLAVVIFYKFVSLHFNKKIAFYATALLTTNGFFIAFSRIAQYQSFVILFSLLCLYFLTLAIKHDRYKLKGIYLGFIFWALSLIFHYDGVFIAPFAFYLLFKWYKSTKDIRTIIYAGLIAAVPILVFYVPFLFTLSQQTLEYWSGRISGDVSTKISSSAYLFSVYQPIYIVHFYIALFVISVFTMLVYPAKRFLGKFKVINALPDVIEQREQTLFVWLWFLVPFIFLEGFVYIPGTHIFNYLMPMTILLAFALNFVESFLTLFRRFLLPEVLSFVGLGVFFCFLYAQSYAIYVDNFQEYPFENEHFLVWDLPQPNPIYHLSIFGFPYYRNWEGIRDAIVATNNNGYYSTNERESISRYYIPLNKSTDLAGFYIYIIYPQSFTGHIFQDKAAYWAEKNPPVFTFSKNGQDLVRVYNMEPGTIAELKLKGF